MQASLQSNIHYHFFPFKPLNLSTQINYWFSVLCRTTEQAVCCSVTLPNCTEGKLTLGRIVNEGTFLSWVYVINLPPSELSTFTVVSPATSILSSLTLLIDPCLAQKSRSCPSFMAKHTKAQSRK